MPEENPPPLRPWVVPLIVFAIDAVFFTFFGITGGLAKLSPAMQFYFGASTFAFPIIIYLILKKRAERGDE
jgi:hypothetical protein